MQKIILIAALAALSACSQKADKKTADSAPQAAPVVPADRVGVFDVKMSDGTMTTTVISANGRYVDTAADGQTENGVFSVKDGKDCFDPEGAEAETCWTVTAPMADGGFTATGSDGTTVTVTPKTAAAPAT